MNTQNAPIRSGLLIIDKPQGVTSHDLVAAVRGRLHMKKVGHAGTLDPMATGVLVIGFGNATRLLNIIVGHTKTYSATIRFGQRTTTDDADGDILPPHMAQHAEQLPDIEHIRSLVNESFTGEIEQVPNAYSAIKVNGKRAYDLARSGNEVELKARPITIHEFEVLEGHAAVTSDGTEVVDVDVKVSCSAGTYIRALARDLGEAFGCGAHLIRLRREAVGSFSADDAHTLTAHVEKRSYINRDGEQVTRNRAVFDQDSDEILACALSMVEAVSAALPVVEITPEEARDLRYGRRLQRTISNVSAAVVPETNDVVAIVDRVDANTVQPITVFAS